MDGRWTRRQVLGGAAALAAMGVPGLVRSARAGAPPIELRDISVISHQPHRYHGWPTVARRRDGQLLLVCSGGREAHVCPFGRVELMRSDDEGHTWTWPRTLIDSAIDDRDAGVLETAEGTILVTSFSSLAYADTLQQAEAAAGEGGGAAWPDDRLERWRAAHRRLDDGQRTEQLGMWMVRSTDGGARFSAPYRVPVNSPHGPIQLADGPLLYAGKELWKDTHRVGVAESADEGETWRWLAEIPTRPGDRQRDYHELHAAEAADGRIIAQLRNHNPTDDRETLQCESADGGRTWTEPRAIGVWGLPSHLLRLRDDRLLMTYGYRREPFGNRARVSEDHGRTWSEAITISDDGAGGDLGYPSTAQLADGSLLTIWYELPADSPNAVLRQARWSLT